MPPSLGAHWEPTGSAQDRAILPQRPRDMPDSCHEPQYPVPPMNSTGVFAPLFFFFNDTATTEIYTLSLHDALPISVRIIWSSNNLSVAKVDNNGTVTGMGSGVAIVEARVGTRKGQAAVQVTGGGGAPPPVTPPPDRKSTRLNSSHLGISYAVFCLKK